LMDSLKTLDKRIIPSLISTISDYRH
jgi:hypothetical protein